MTHDLVRDDIGMVFVGVFKFMSFFGSWVVVGRGVEREGVEREGNGV